MICYTSLFVFISSIVSISIAYPLADGQPPPASLSDEDVVYDQRQNGSENLRIHMSDVTFVIAPSEGILQLMSASAADYLNNNEQPSTSAVGGNSGKPSANPYAAFSDCASESGAKCKQQPHKKLNRIRLSNILMPLLNRAASSQSQ